MNFIVVTFCYVLALTLTQYWQSYGLVSSIDSISMRVQTSWSSIRLQRNLISGVEIIGRSCSVWRLRTETHFQLKELNYSRCFTKLPIDLRNISSGVRDEQLCRERWRATFQWMINGRFMLIVVDLNKKNMEREKKKNFWKLFIWNEKKKKRGKEVLGVKLVAATGLLSFSSSSSSSSPSSPPPSPSPSPSPSTLPPLPHHLISLGVNQKEKKRIESSRLFLGAFCLHRWKWWPRQLAEDRYQIISKFTAV